MPIFRREPPNGGVEYKGVWKNPAFRPLFSPIYRYISETVIVRWAHAARQFVSMAIVGLTHWLKHHITRKLLKIDGYMLRGVWQALNCLSIRATYCVIVAQASPEETKMWAAVRRNGVARPPCISWASCSLRYGDILFFFKMAAVRHLGIIVFYHTRSPTRSLLEFHVNLIHRSEDIAIWIFRIFGLKCLFRPPK